MNNLQQMERNVSRLLRIFKPAILCGCLVMAMAETKAAATVDTYENDVVFDYPISPSVLPTIDATNFINNNTFSINFSALTYNNATFTYNTEIYEPRNVVNYFNYDTMAINTGFQFDTLKSNNTHEMAGSFYNGGTINSASYSYYTIYGGTYLGVLYSSYVGQCFVSATNIENPGVIVGGLDGLIRLNGQHLDLSRGAITLEGLGLFSSLSGMGVSGLTSDIGVNTNKLTPWNPSQELTTNSAYSSAPDYLYLINPTSYIDINDANETNIIVRAVFINNNFNPSVTNNVYFGSSSVGGGFATVEWIGTYVDSSTGLTQTNYLYLNNNYLLGASTNAAVLNNGVPNNFTFQSSTNSLAVGTPADSGFPDGFEFMPDDSVTNTYSYVDAQMISTTVATNASDTNPSGALTNMPGRIQINATRDLDLSLAQISGANYLSLTCTNQFNGSEGASISAPYSDINLGVTNGVLTVSNLIASTLPNWAGTVQAWSATWKYTDTNSSTNAITYDFRVLLVDSQLNPTTPAAIQDLVLHATNSLILSDSMSVLRKVSIDSKSLTLTDNGYGVGAGAFQGELNWVPTTTFGPTQLPNLLWLTNNGAINVANLLALGNSSARYGTIINNNSISDQGTTIWTTNFVDSGYIFSGYGNFVLQSLNTTLSNDIIYAAGDISITGDSLVAGNSYMQAGKSLTFTLTNMLSDMGADNPNDWTVTGSSAKGFSLPVKPQSGSLLGTTVNETAPAPSVVVPNVWAAQDMGASASGYANNAAIGRLYLDALGNNSQFAFKGTGTNNAIYVDYLEFLDKATNWNLAKSNMTALAISSNMVIYYADAVINGTSVAAQINHWNTNHLRWVPGFAGSYSSTNIVYGGTTNTVNTALLLSTNLDSDGDGIVNASDPDPFFLSSQVDFTVTLTNVPPLKVLLQWETFPTATNVVLYTTNLAAPTWMVLTNFVTPVLPPSPPVSVSAFDSVNSGSPRYYRVRLDSPAP